MAEEVAVNIMLGRLKFKAYKDWSKGSWQDIQSSVAPENSSKAGINLNSDEEIGSLLSRKGTTIVGSQLIDGKDILGLHNYRDSLGANDKLFAAISDGTNTDIYDVIAGTKSLEDDYSPVSVSISPSVSKSVSPSNSISPSVSSSLSPSLSPSRSSSISPSVSPPDSLSSSASPSLSPSASSSLSPSTSPSVSLSLSPSISVSLSPSRSASISPSSSPSVSRSYSPSRSSSISPSVSPPNSYSLSKSPSLSPSTSPSSSVSPSSSPSAGSFIGLKTRFLTYLNSCLRLNGVNQAKSYNGTSWETTGGVFDLDNIPSGSKYAIEFKDRVYVAGNSNSPDKVDISSIADSNTRTISWDVNDGAKFIVFEQEDGGGGITGLWKVPGYVLVGKKRTLKRYDGSSAYPEDMINQGIPSQEAGVVAQGILFFANENGAWATEGGKPKKISTYTVDKIIKSCPSENLEDIALGTDEEHILISLPYATISGESYTNVVLKYNIFQNTWDIRKYPTNHKVYAKYVDSDGASFTVLGDNDGSVRKLDTGNDDDGIGITYSLETQDIDFGMRGNVKKIPQLNVLTENVSKGSLMWRNTHSASDWKDIGTIDKEVVNLSPNIEGNYFNFKITETVDSGQAKIIGFEIPAGVEIYE